eukprot:3093323-Alexandrium_andersonii.AAC.1
MLSSRLSSPYAPRWSLVGVRRVAPRRRRAAVAVMAVAADYLVAATFSSSRAASIWGAVLGGGP